MRKIFRAVLILSFGFLISCGASSGSPRIVGANITAVSVPSTTNTTKPVEGGVSANTTKPVDGGMSANTTKPVDGGMSANSTKPVDGGMSANTTKPVDGGMSANTTAPVDGGMSANTTKPTPPATDPNTFGGITYTPCSLDIPSASQLPSGTGPDPLQPYQWYLREEYANVTGAWQLMDYDNNQVDIQVGVIDNALQIDHEDLNILDETVTNASINIYVPQGHPHKHNPYPEDCQVYNGIQAHGTSVAGVIAAKGNNRRGTRGVAYKSKVWGANLILKGLGYSDIEEVFTHRLAETAIMSNSWGFSAPTLLIRSFGNDLPGLLDNGIQRGFGGKGISYVFSAGNSRRNHYNSTSKTSENEIANSGDRSSYAGLLNHRGVIPVCAVGVDHNFSSYSEPGPNLWICGYSSAGRVVLQDKADIERNAHLSTSATLNYLGLPTLDLSGAAGFNRGLETYFGPNSQNNCVHSRYAFNFGSPKLQGGECIIPRNPPIIVNVVENSTITWDHLLQDGADRESLLSYHRHLTGTSAAAPLVSGVIALMRAANTDLTWRDVKLILAESAKQPSGVDSFIGGAGGYFNQATNYTHSEDYGFGIIDAASAVSMAQAWQLLPPEQPSFIKDSTANSNTIAVNQTDTPISFIEHVQVKVLGGQRIGNLDDLHLELTSPTGVNSTFVVPHQCIRRVPPNTPDRRVYAKIDSCSVFGSSFTFATAKYLGETPVGEWQLTALINGIAKDLNWQLILHGH